VSERYRKKLELIVRKPERGDDLDPPLAPCPYCNLPGPDTELQCAGCQAIIPFDIATGGWGLTCWAAAACGSVAGSLVLAVEVEQAACLEAMGQ